MRVRNGNRVLNQPLPTDRQALTWLSSSTGKSFHNIEWRWNRRYRQELEPFRLAGVSGFDVGESGDQEVLHTGDTEEPKIHVDQSHHTCPCKTLERTAPDTSNM